MKRRPMKRREDRKLFNKGRKPDRRNVSLPPMRGGYRL